ncbi:MAG: HAMP domain-containing histidine kinase [Lachnospiraceae bacterium]|nr:HAMP domain-containing histidine kinase [Lachnospiraceae bacterium]
MSKYQKLTLVLATVLYILTIFGFFYLKLPFIIALFVLFTIAMLTFAYLCFKQHNDYTGAEHLQQEIGILNAEKEQMRIDNEKSIEEKNSDIRKMQLNIDDLTSRLAENEEELSKFRSLHEEETERNVSSADKSADMMIEGLLPPDDENDAVTVDIIEVARRAISELQSAAREAGLRINISSASDKLMVHASAKRLLIMFRNIIDNSIKYMQTEGTLVITISAIEDDIFIVLKDTGKGLPENETKHIFELNYQGSNRISGNGLGLTQAKAIVEHYGGTIYARSPAGSGMGIYIQLPTS